MYGCIHVLCVETGDNLVGAQFSKKGRCVSVSTVWCVAKMDGCVGVKCGLCN